MRGGNGRQKPSSSLIPSWSSASLSKPSPFSSRQNLLVEITTAVCQRKTQQVSSNIKYYLVLTFGADGELKGDAEFFPIMWGEVWFLAKSKRARTLSLQSTANMLLTFSSSQRLRLRESRKSSVCFKLTLLSNSGLAGEHLILLKCSFSWSSLFSDLLVNEWAFEHEAFLA